jgi:membrane peptidoglycan carboxypeptidase
LNRRGVRHRTREKVAEVAQTRHPWRQRATVVLVVLVVAPILTVATLWGLTPSVANAKQLVSAHLSAHHSPELVVLPQPDRVAQALIATEDGRFYQTPGIDPLSTARAGLGALIHNGDTGAATLEQQLAKNLYIPQDDGLVAKARVAELALKLDASYSKNDVLRMYLAYVYFGHGYYGLPAAAQGYFGVTAAQLSWPQASMLAGLVQAPSAYDPIDHFSTGRLRQRHVLDRLVASHVLSAGQADAIFAAPLGLQ